MEFYPLGGALWLFWEWLLEKMSGQLHHITAPNLSGKDKNILNILSRMGF